MGNASSAALGGTGSETGGSTHNSSNDILGVPGLQDSKAFRQLVLQQFRQCMAAFPRDISKEYYEAVKHTAATAVQIEAPELKFLQFEGFNPWTASLRCLRYWKSRRATFQETAFLPLTLSSKGALKDVDLEILKSGALCLGSFEPAGTSGLIFCIDTLMLRSFMADDAAAAQRCIFYLLNICVEHNESLSGGVTFVLFADDNVGQCINDFANWQKMVTEAFPIKQAAVHIVPSGLSSSNLGSSEITHNLSSSHKVELKVHWSHSKEDLVCSLEKLGIPVEFLPERMGGVGSQERALLWHNQRMRSDVERYESTNFPSDASGSTDSSFIRNHQQQQHQQRPQLQQKLQQQQLDHVPSTQSGSGQTTTTSSTSTHRIQEVTHHTESESPSSTKKRKTDLSDLDKDNLSLDANELDREEFIRKRNAVYSKRKYHRKKIEIEVLKKQAAEMKVDNDMLRAQGDTLEALLQSVKAKIVMAEASQGLSPLVPTARTSPPIIGNLSNLGNGGTLPKRIPSPIRNQQVLVNVNSVLPSTHGLLGQGQPSLPSSGHGPVPSLVAALQPSGQVLSSLFGSATQPVTSSPPILPLAAPQPTTSPTAMMQILSSLLGTSSAAGTGPTANPTQGTIHSSSTDASALFGMLHPLQPPPPAPPPPAVHPRHSTGHSNVSHPSSAFFASHGNGNSNGGAQDNSAQFNQLLEQLLKAGQPVATAPTPASHHHHPPKK